MRIGAKVRGADLRRTMYDVGRCFCTSPLAAGVLSSKRSTIDAVVVRDVMQKVSACNHEPRLCEECALQVLEVCRTWSEDSPQLCKLARSLCNASIDRDTETIECIATSLANLISHALIIKAAFKDKFHQK